MNYLKELNVLKLIMQWVNVCILCKYVWKKLSVSLYAGFYMALIFSLQYVRVLVDCHRPDTDKLLSNWESSQHLKKERKLFNYTSILL